MVVEANGAVAAAAVHRQKHGEPRMTFSIVLGGWWLQGALSKQVKCSSVHARIWSNTGRQRVAAGVTLGWLDTADDCLRQPLGRKIQDQCRDASRRQSDAYVPANHRGESPGVSKQGDVPGRERVFCGPRFAARREASARRVTRPDEPTPRSDSKKYAAAGKAYS